jgi:hypothetical protein
MMSFSSSVTPAPSQGNRLDGIAADLERELDVRVCRLEREIADARQLIEVAKLLADAEREAELTGELQRLQAERKSLERAAGILRQRRPAREPAASPKHMPAPLAPQILTTMGNGAAPGTAVNGTECAAEPHPDALPPPGPRNGVPAGEHSGSRPYPAATDPVRLPTTTPAGRAAPELPTAPRWTPRMLDVLEREREAIVSAVAAFTRPDPVDLARFKAQVSRFRGAYEERKRHAGSQADWRALEMALKEAQRALWPDHYCIPLDLKTTLVPERWQQLSHLYGDLATAVEALGWVETTAGARSPSWLGREATPLLEAVGAATATLHRWLRRQLSWAHDNQQDDLFRRLRRLGEEHAQFIRSLQPEELISDDELECLVRELPRRLEALRAAQCRKSTQESALAGLAALLAEEGFGGRERDDDRLCEAAARCLDAKIPATDRGLRDRLLDVHWMLEGDERLTRLYQAVVDEIERRRRKAEEEEGAEPGRSDRLDDLTPELREQRAALLSRTRGKTGVMIGGTCREESRRALQEALELADLRWPDSDPSDPFDRSAREIARADIVFLTRFNRQRSKEAIPLCRDQGKVLIRLPGGYGLNQVIAQAYHQIFGRE